MKLQAANLSTETEILWGSNSEVFESQQLFWQKPVSENWPKNVNELIPCCLQKKGSNPQFQEARDWWSCFWGLDPWDSELQRFVETDESMRSRWLALFSGESTPPWWMDTPWWIDPLVNQIYRKQASFGQARGLSLRFQFFFSDFLPSKKWTKWDTGIFFHKKWRLLPVATYILLCCPFLVLVNHSFTVFSSSRLMARWCKQTCWGAALAKLYPCHAWEPVLYCLVAHCPCCIHLAELVRWPGQS